MRVNKVIQIIEEKKESDLVFGTDKWTLWSRRWRLCVTRRPIFGPPPSLYPKYCFLRTVLPVCVPINRAITDLEVLYDLSYLI